MVDAADMTVEAAVAAAPVTGGYPAITPNFLALLHCRGFQWSAQGLIPKRQPTERFPSFLTAWRSSKSGKCVWWVGSAPSECTCSPQDFAALLAGQAQPDGTLIVGGRAMRLTRADGWAQLEPTESHERTDGVGVFRVTGVFSDDNRMWVEPTDAVATAQMHAANATRGTAFMRAVVCPGDAGYEDHVAASDVLERVRKASRVPIRREHRGARGHDGGTMQADIESRGRRAR